MLREVETSEFDTNMKDASELKDEGSKESQGKNFTNAANLRSASLNACGEGTRALLSNWSICCLHTKSHLDAVAASSASLGIRPEGKAFVRLTRALLTLGEPGLCRKLSEKYSFLVEGSP